MDELNIGKKLQEFRKQRGLTLREVAEQTGITPSMLSQMERGLVNPSINTLKAISKTLDIPLFRFFQEGETGRTLVVREGMRKTIGWPDQHDVQYDLLTPDVSGSIEFCLMKLPGRCSSGQANQRHDGEEVAYILAGPVVLSVEGEKTELCTGDSVRIPAGSEHRWENPGKQDAQVIFAVTPPSF
ncbi:helix-turn-helix domain-containing protein [Merdimmobilis hominis]|uniref:helix-turn-helix domain-containing protein n=1 Tax=Merdimmobilis hominis TaxID=2897707 RepID=UPI0006C822F9|nr:helix-turn-helix domain-containing protein [Merdimmobilis hominis]